MTYNKDQCLKMDNRIIRGIIVIVAMFIVVYIIDSLFLRHLFWQRLIANIVIVIVFLAFIYRYILNKKVGV